VKSACHNATSAPAWAYFVVSSGRARDML
jgi:hypothetical protein